MFNKTLKVLNKNVKFLKYNKNFSKNYRHFTSSAILKQNGSSEDETIVVDKDEHITLIGINRVKQRNAINFKTAEKLSKALSEFEANINSSVAVLYGVGGSFCAGYDIQELQSQCEKGSLDFLLRHEGSVGPTRRHSTKPIICGISGFCVASGLELALMCDLRVMEETAILGFFNRRFGVPMSDGGTIRLASMVGQSRAVELLLSGRRITGKEALQIGLVNRLVASGTALGQAVNLAFSIAKFPQASIIQDRSALYMNAYTRHGFRQAMQTEVMSTSREVLTELKEGVQRFKRSETTESEPDTFQIKPKHIPDWELSEIEHENKNKTKSNKNIRCIKLNDTIMKFDELKMEELKKKLSKLELSTTGNKVELQKRLIEEFKRHGIGISTFEFEDKKEELEVNMPVPKGPNDINAMFFAMMEEHMAENSRKLLTEVQENSRANNEELLAEN